MSSIFFIFQDQLKVLSIVHAPPPVRISNPSTLRTRSVESNFQKLPSSSVSPNLTTDTSPSTPRIVT